jgi:hypothetical protein
MQTGEQSVTETRVADRFLLISVGGVTGLLTDIEQYVQYSTYLGTNGTKACLKCHSYIAEEKLGGD